MGRSWKRRAAEMTSELAVLGAVPLAIASAVLLGGERAETAKSTFDPTHLRACTICRNLAHAEQTEAAKLDPVPDRSTFQLLNPRAL